MGKNFRNTSLLGKWITVKIPLSGENQLHVSGSPLESPLINTLAMNFL